VSQPCSSELCPDLIRFAISDTTGKRMPIDAEPNPDGNLAVRQDEPGGPLRCRPLPKGAELQPGEKRAMPHWATCKDTKRFRKQKQTGETTDDGA
jgi:hypothetical protein